MGQRDHMATNRGPVELRRFGLAVAERLLNTADRQALSYSSPVC